MIFAWFMAILVPALATLGSPWLAAYLGRASDDVYGDPQRLLIHFFLATAPMLALAVFSLVASVQRSALRSAVVGAALVTLGIWGWYHAGAVGVALKEAGLILLISPILVGIVALLIYRLTARRV